MGLVVATEAPGVSTRGCEIGCRAIMVDSMVVRKSRVIISVVMWVCRREVER